MIKPKFSKNYDAVKSRIRRLPKLVEQTADTFSKKDAVALIQTFRDGIKNDSFGLTRLKTKTVLAKSRQGKPKPTTPLYGDGENEKNSYINLFAIRKIKNGYRVFARWAKHHESSLSLRDLFEIHEKGALIKMKNGGIIRIPPRPAFSKTFRRFLNKKKKAENVKAVRDAMDKLIHKGNEQDFKKLFSKNSETDKFDET
jgi:bifunctional DNA-binding transcriptional regulator/antitoxin component of YhaV-PrlF toxin-antitoxin module